MNDQERAYWTFCRLFHEAGQTDQRLILNSIIDWRDLPTDPRIWSLDGPEHVQRALGDLASTCARLGLTFDDVVLWDRLRERLNPGPLTARAWGLG